MQRNRRQTGEIDDHTSLCIRQLSSESRTDWSQGSILCTSSSVGALEMRLKDGLYGATNLKSEITNLKFGKARILAPLISRPRKILVFFYVSLKMSIVM